MKFVRVSTAVVCGALLAGMPGLALAGAPDCGCATQKGGIVQKGGVAQKGGIVQHGPVAQKGGVYQKGGVEQKGGVYQKGGVHQKGGAVQKGAACGGCGMCDLCGLPMAVLNGLDGLLNSIFCCNTCGGKGSDCGCDGAWQKGGVAQKGCGASQKDCGASQKGCGIAQKGCGASQKSCGGKDCGCGGGGYAPGNSDSANPFIDDLQPPPIPNDQARSRQLLNQRQSQARVQPQPAPTRTVVRPVSTVLAKKQPTEPRLLPAEVVAPISAVEEIQEQPKVPTVIRTSSVTNKGVLIPRNPLRGE